MELYLYNTPDGLKPCYGDDYDKKKKLRVGMTYKAKISVPRNMALHRKYFKLISLSWDMLPARERAFFGSVESFRKTVEVAAGHCDRVYNLDRKEWVETPRSVSLDKMEGDEFEDLYARVKDVILNVFLTGMPEKEFMLIFTEF